MQLNRWKTALARWKQYDDGSVWFGIYLSRTLMLTYLALISALAGAHSVALFVVFIVIPYNVGAQFLHRKHGRARNWLPLNQLLAALCAVLAPQAFVGAVLCMMASAIDAMGLPVRRVQAFAASGTVILLSAAIVHHNSSMAAYAVAQLASCIAISNVVSYLKNKRSASSERFESLLDGLHAFVYEADLETGEITFCNQQTLDRIGPVKNISELLARLHPEDVEMVTRSYVKGMSTLTPMTLEVRVVLEDTVLHMEQRTTFAKYRGRVRVRSVLFDVSSRKRVELEMQHRAFHDSLTELPNRALFLDRLQHALDRAERTKTRHAVLLLDLDNFKDVNDGMGHQVGDELLIEVGKRLGRIARRTDTLARLGGDEFAVLLEDTTREAALRIGQELVDSVGQSYQNGEMSLVPRISIGVATYPLNGSTGSELLRHADMAMYHAKRHRLGVSAFDDTMNPASAQKLALLADFRSALTDGQLEAYFQPVVDSESGRVSSCEALVRWNHPELGLMSPASFVPTICAGGLSGDLARWMLAEAIEQIDTWNSLNVAVPIAVNLSAVDIADSKLIDWLLSELASRNIPTRLLTIELTESELLDQSMQTIEILKRLNDAGVTIAVDDFGTGYSSLVWLRDLPICTLKIDRSFIESMFTDERSETIVRSTIQMAQALGLQIVGEGVENNHTASALRRLGCDNLQGYLFSKPVRANEMLNILSAGSYPVDGPLAILA
jgi:diguanylate cyclase (GGDEF)-like protein